MYPDYKNLNQVYDLTTGVSMIVNHLPISMQKIAHNNIDVIVSKYEVLDEHEYIEELKKSNETLGFRTDVKFLDSGWYIFIDEYLIVVDNKPISPIEPVNMIDRVFIQYGAKDYVLKLFYYPFTNNDTFHEGYTLGVTRHGHDSSAALVENISGKVIAFEREERSQRLKPTFDFPTNAIQGILDAHGVKLPQIKAITVGHNIHWFEDMPSSKSPASICFENLGDGFVKKDFWVRFRNEYMMDRIKEALPELDLKLTPIYYVRHHTAHAASHSVPPEITDGENLFLVMDGRGEWDTITAWLLEDQNLKNVLNIGMPNTIGDMYNMMGRFMGWREFGVEGQIMGLAPYGEPRDQSENEIYNKLYDIFKDFIQIKSNPWAINLNPKYYFGSFKEEYLSKMRGWITPYSPSDYFLEAISPYVSPMPEGIPINPDNPDHRAVCILAFVLQTRTQEAILALVRHLKSRFPNAKNLYLSGGVALNVTINGEIIRKDIFKNKNLFTTPVPGDDGLSIGSALYLIRYYKKLKPTDYPYKSALLGREYTLNNIKDTFSRFSLKPEIDFHEFADFGDLLDEVSSLLLQGHGVAWFQGREEAGPRALGARSILFGLNDPNANLRANKSKKRQPWRPSAISILQEDAKIILEYCDHAPFMSIAFKSKESHYIKLSPGLHPADKSTRPQTVTSNEAPHLYELLLRIKKLSGIGAVLNTSFNRSEPIVHYPDDALNTLYYLDGINYLAISNFVFMKGNYKPSIIALSEEEDLRVAYSEFRSTGNLSKLVILLTQYPLLPHQVKIQVGALSFPMFKEGFDGKVMQLFIKCLFENYGLDESTTLNIEPLNTPYRKLLLKSLNTYISKIGT